MTFGTVKLSMMIAAVICLLSCGPHSVEVVPQENEIAAANLSTSADNKTAEPATVSKSKVEEIPDYLKAGPEFRYKSDAKLKKIDRKWFFGGWYHIDPQFAFSIEETCETDNIIDLAENGEIQEPILGEKIGYWDFSDGKLTMRWFQYDKKNNLTNNIKTSVAHVGKVAERVAIMVYDDGKIEAMMGCP